MTDAGGDSGDDHVFISRLEPGDGAGPTLAVKDCIDVAGVVTTAGCPALAEVAEPAAGDAACLTGAHAAGARLVGKTNLHELCFGATGVNPHYGTPRNPLDPVRIPGGSSSGSAVAVATGQADIAYGTDTAGSVRNPAACCGIVGLKTTLGRIPVEGTRPLAPSMDTIGPLARDVAGVIAGMALLEPGFVAAAVPGVGEIRLARFTGVLTDPRIDRAIDTALRAAGVSVTDVSIGGWAQAHGDGLDLMYREALEVNRSLVADHSALLGSDVHARFERARALTDSHVDAVRRRRGSWQDELAATLAGVDALVLGGLTSFPSLLSELDPASNVAGVAVSFAGFPALCVPVPTVDGPATAAGTPYPASIQLVGPPGSEEFLVAIGGLIEVATVGPRTRRTRSDVTR